MAKIRNMISRKRHLFEVLLLLFILISGCEKNNEINKETNALNEVFKQLTDSIINYRDYPIPPPPSPYGLPPDVVSKECLEHYDSLMIEYKRLLSLMDTNKHVIAINDSLIEYSEHMSDVVKMFRTEEVYPEFNGAFDSYINKRKKAQILDIKMITNTGKYTLSDYSTIANQIKANQIPLFKFYYYGELIFSRIYFDKDEKTGVFECKNYCGQDCYNSYFVMIEKIESKWCIYKGFSLQSRGR